MNNLEQKLTSMEVAEMVEKDHKNLLRDIREYIYQLGESKIEPISFFTESDYTDKSNRKKPCYLITKKGCEFIAHKLTGVKGTVFTAKYINRFHYMEDKIKNKPLTAIEQLQLTQQAVIEVNQKIESVDDDLQSFKNDMPLLAVECEKITKAVKARGLSALGGKTSNAYQDNSLRGKVYSDIHNEVRRQFGVNTYKAIKRNQCDSVIAIIDEYELPLCLQECISDENAQIRMDD